MRSKIFIDEKEFEIIIQRKNVKNINIRIKENSIIYVSCPYKISYKTVEDVIHKNKKWIIKNTLKIKEQIKEKDKSKGKLLYLGKNYNINVVINTFNKIDILENEINIYSKNLDKEFIDNKIKEWYYSQANIILFEEVEAISKKLSLYPSKIFIGNQKTLWGSCNSKKHIRLNWRLILMPKAVREYVMIHEMCHLIYMNHSPNFWNLVNKYDPEYKKNQLWLKDNGRILMNIY